jgi:hypothetical protein
MAVVFQLITHAILSELLPFSLSIVEFTQQESMLERGKDSEAFRTLPNFKLSTMISDDTPTGFLTVRYSQTSFDMIATDVLSNRLQNVL